MHSAPNLADDVISVFFQDVIHYVGLEACALQLFRVILGRVEEGRGVGTK
jgi:hypothetical protein